MPSPGTSPSRRIRYRNHPIIASSADCPRTSGAFMPQKLLKLKAVFALCLFLLPLLCFPTLLYSTSTSLNFCLLGYSYFNYIMYRQLFSVAALAATTFAQNATNSSSSGTPSLTQLLGSTDSLSTLRTAIQGVPGLGDILGSASNVTVLAPSNEAFEKFMSTPQGAALADNDQDAIQVGSLP